MIEYKDVIVIIFFIILITIQLTLNKILRILKNIENNTRIHKREVEDDR